MKDCSLSSLQKKLNKINFKKVPEILFLFGIFVLPFQIFTIISQPDIYLSGQANQFNNATIYLTDIFVILSAIGFFPILEKISIGNKIISGTLLALAILIIVLNTVFPIGWLIFRLAIFVLTYLLLVNGITKKETLFKTLLLAGSIQALIAVGQFIKQGSIGLGFLGEPNLSAPEIAKIDIGDQKTIRSYGTMSHPNILGGFLVIAIILGINLKKWLPAVVICLAGLIFTFSRSAMVALLAVSILYAIFHAKTLMKFSKKHLIVLFIPAVIILAITPTLKAHLFSTYEIEERLNQLGPTIDMITENPLGVGFLNFTNEIQSYTDEKLMPWEYQPIHNIYLLATAELGVTGIILLLFLIFYSLLNSKNTKYALIALAIIGLADHYLITLYQGQMIAIIAISLWPYSHYGDSNGRDRIFPV